MCRLMYRYTYGFCCWRITVGNVINIFLIKDIFLPSHPTVIDQDTFYDLSHLIHGLRSVHTQRDTAASPPPPQSKIGLYFHMQSNRVADGTDDWAQGSNSRWITSLTLSEDECHWLICVRPWYIWLFKGM